MADTTTWGVKVDQELKERINKLLEQSGLSGREFMAALVQTYEAKLVKEAVPVISSDLEEIQSIARRIVDAYINLGEKIVNLQKEKELEAQTAIKEKDSIISTLQNKINNLETSNAQLSDELQNLVNENNELSNKVNQLTEVNQNMRALLAEYKDKNESMASLLDEYKKYKDDYVKLAEDNKNLLDAIRHKEQEIKELKKTIEALKNEHDMEIQRLKRDIDDVKQRAEFEKDKMLLLKEQEYQKQKQELIEQYNSKIHELLQEIRRFSTQ